MGKVESKLSKNFITTVISVLVVIAAYIRVNGVGDYYYNGDEALHIGIASGKSLSQILHFSLYEYHPPLGHLIRYYWLLISKEIWFVRGLALPFGLALIPIYYFIGKKLNGEFTGICAAILVAFSPALITQSYIARNYTIFLFFLSISFYCYLKWKDAEDENKSLFLYFLFAVLACLTHFSAIMTIFVIAACETIRLFLLKSNKFRLIKWIVTNIVIAMIFCVMGYIWRNTVNSAGVINIEITYKEILLRSINYIIVLFGYMALGKKLTIFLILLIPLQIKYNNKILAIVIMNAIGFGLIITLIINNLYDQTLRRSLWLLPFVISLMAWIMANIYKIISMEVFKRVTTFQQKIFVIVLVLIGVIGYNKQERFSDALEYQSFTRDWQEADKYLNGIDKKSVIIAELLDTALLNNNIYQYFNQDWGNESAVITVKAPYKETNIIFNSHYYVYIEKQPFIESMKWIRDNNLLENSDNLIFMATNWTGGQNYSAPIPSLFLCLLLDKKIVAFPALKPDETLTKENLYNHTALFMSVSKKDFYEQVVSPTGKANSCLDRK